MKADKVVETLIESQRIQESLAIVEKLTTESVSFSAERSTLPQTVNSQAGFVHVSNRRSGDFYAAKEAVLVELIQKTAEQIAGQPSIFDGMSEFESGAPIGLAALESLTPHTPEYTKDTLESLAQLNNAN